MKYFEEKGYINYSLLKALSTSPRDAYSILQGGEIKQTPALNFGSLVDTMISNPENVEKEFAVFSGVIPTDKMYDVAIKYIELRTLIENPDEEVDEDTIALNARAEVGYNATLKNETFLIKFKKSCGDFVTFIVNNNDKIFIDKETYDRAQQLVAYTKQSQFLQHIFNPIEGTEVLYQVPIYVNTTKFSGKILIDCVVIDHNKKTITPYDFKTYEGSFVINYYKYKYYYQESWYTLILDTLSHSDFFIDSIIPNELKVLESGTYKVEKFKFIAIDKSFNRSPIVYASYYSLVEDVVFKGVLKQGMHNYTKIKSIENLIKELNYRQQNDNWMDDYDMLINGIKEI